jgi:hypothetical protein
MNEELEQLDKKPTPSFNRERSKETTISDAQFSAPSVAKSERGGGDNLKDKVLP